MKRILVLILIMTVAIAAVAAPPRRGAGPGAQRGPGGGRAVLPPQAIADFLALSEAQSDQLKSLRESMKTTTEPLREQQRANREAMQAALEAGDTAKAGEIAMAGHKVRQQIKAAHDTFQTSFAALLTPEQKEKWDVYQQIVKLRRPERDR